MLDRLQHKNLAKEASEDDGIGVYVFLWSHIERAIGDWRVYTDWGYTMPHYTLINDEVVRRGNFADGSGAISTLYEYLNKSYTIRYFNFNLPFHTGDEHYISATEIISRAKEKYIEQIGNDNFYVLIHPTNWSAFTQNRKNKFLGHLDERDINYFDYSDTLKLDDNHIIIGDGHPNSLSNQKLSKLLISDLRIDTTDQSLTKAPPNPQSIQAKQ